MLEPALVERFDLFLQLDGSTLLRFEPLYEVCLVGDEVGEVSPVLQVLHDELAGRGIGKFCLQKLYLFLQPLDIGLELSILEFKFTDDILVAGCFGS